MEFSLGRDTLPSQARSVRGESRRLRRERDDTKTLLSRCPLWRIAQRDRAVVIMRPAFSPTWGTAADAKSVHDHLSRHHTGSIMERARFDISLRTSTYMLDRQNEQSPPRASVYRIPPHATAGWTGPGHFHGRARSYSLATQRNHNLTGTTVISSSQRRTVRRC